MAHRLPWTERFRPRSFNAFVGNIPHVASLVAWLKAFTPRQPKSCLVLSGPFGIGKTSLVRLVAEHCGHTVVALNAASRYSRRMFLDAIRTTLHPTTLGRHLGLNMRPKLLVIEEINAIVSSGKGSAELKTLLEQLEDAQRPLICITDARGEEGIRRLVHIAERVEMGLPDEVDISRHLKGIVRQVSRNPNLNPTHIALCERLATACQGNIRKAVMDLQCAYVSRIVSSSKQKQATCSSHAMYTSFYDAYGDQTLYHTLNYMIASQGKNRGRKPTKKSCYGDDDKTTQPTKNIVALRGRDAERNLLDISQSLVEAEHLRAHMARDHDDLETECVDELAPYVAYFACGAPFKLSPLPVPLDRVSCPSHASTCKRYVSNIRSLHAHLRNMLYEADAPLTRAPQSVLLSDQHVFASDLLAPLKRILCEPLLAGKLEPTLRYMKRFQLDVTKLEDISKCATYTGQKKPGRELDRDAKTRIGNALATHSKTFRLKRTSTRN